MSTWEFFAALNGVARHNAPKGGAKLTETQIDELFDWIDVGPSGERELSTEVYDFDDEFGFIPDGRVSFTVQ